jgi:hypothetical protein
VLPISKILFVSNDGKLGDAVVNTAFVDGVLGTSPAPRASASTTS